LLHIGRIYSCFPFVILIILLLPFIIIIVISYNSIVVNEDMEIFIPSTTVQAAYEKEEEGTRSFYVEFDIVKDEESIDRLPSAFFQEVTKVFSVIRLLGVPF